MAPRSSAVDARRAQPIGALARRIDHRESALCNGRRLVADNRPHRSAPSRERGREQVAILRDHRIDFSTGKHEKPANGHPGVPPEAARDLRRGPLVPAELTLDRAKVVEPSLDLDDKQRSGPRIEGEQVDPAMRVRVDDLDLPGCQPPRATEAAIGARRASSVNEVTLTTLTDDGRDPADDVDLKIQ